MLAPPTYITIIERVFTLLDILLNKFVEQGYGVLVHTLKYPLGLAVVLYIVLLGISITQGWVKLSVSNFVKSALKIGLIYTFAMNWGCFSNYVIKFIEGGASQIGAILLAGAQGIVPIPHFAGEGINGAMQSVLIEVARVGHWIWGAGSWHNATPCFIALIIWLFGYLMIVVALLELALAKVMLAVLFVTAPLFISFTMFKPTHGFFDRWLGSIVGFALVIIFVSAVMTLALSMVQWTIIDMYTTHALNVNVVGFVPVIIAGILGVGIILTSCRIAQHIGGMVSTASSSSLLAGAVGGAMGASFSALKIPGGAIGAARKIMGMGTGGIATSASSAIKFMQKNLRKDSGE